MSDHYFWPDVRESVSIEFPNAEVVIWSDGSWIVSRAIDDWDEGQFDV